jgi:hypothetical protein
VQHLNLRSAVWAAAWRADCGVLRWIIGLLDYWIIGLLDYWIIGLLDYWIIETSE